MTIGGGGVVSTASVGSNPFAVGGIYPAAVPVQASPQYMLVQTGSGPCYVPVTNVPFGPAVMSPPPAFSTPAAAQFQLPNPQQQASFAFHGQMHPANPFLVIVFLMLCLPYFHTWYGLSANLGCRSEMCFTRLGENAGRKKSPKSPHLRTIAQLCRAISSQLRHVSTIGNKLVKHQCLLHMSSQYGELRPSG